MGIAELMPLLVAITKFGDVELVHIVSETAESSRAEGSNSQSAPGFINCTVVRMLDCEFRPASL